MKFWQFIFFFLYVRNWNTGQHEISRERLTVLFVGLFLLFLGLFLVTIMQKPVTYTANTEVVGN